MYTSDLLARELRSLVIFEYAMQKDTGTQFYREQPLSVLDRRIGKDLHRPKEKIDT